MELEDQEPREDSPDPPDCVEPPLPQILCRYCGWGTFEGDRFCAHCGKRQNTRESWYYHPLWILFLALVVIGPFALILVWRSARMGPVMKALMAGIIIVYTLFCAYTTYRIVVMELSYLGELDEMMRQIRRR